MRGTDRGARNTDGRSFKTIGGERVKVNFLIFYEIAQQTVKTVLRLVDYDSEWVLLASIDAIVPIEPGPEPGAHGRARGPGPEPRTWTRTCREGDQRALTSSHGLFS